MKTIFDIGDKIEFNAVGTVVQYTCNGNGDCYVINLDDHADLYMDTETLIAAGAKLVNNKNDISTSFSNKNTETHEEICNDILEIADKYRNGELK